MQSVSSNAVAEAIKTQIVPIWFSKRTTQSYITVSIAPYTVGNYNVVGGVLHYTSREGANASCLSWSCDFGGSQTVYVYVRQGTSLVPDNARVDGYLLLCKK